MPTKTINLERKSSAAYSVIHEASGQLVGEFFMIESGYYEFFPNNWTGSGYIEVYIFQEIMDMHRLLNKDWDDEIEKYFKEQEEKDKA